MYVLIYAILPRTYENSANSPKTIWKNSSRNVLVSQLPHRQNNTSNPLYSTTILTTRTQVQARVHSYPDQPTTQVSPNGKTFINMLLNVLGFRNMECRLWPSRR